PPGEGGGYPPPPWGGHPPPPPPPGGGYGHHQQPANTGMMIGALVANIIGLCLRWDASRVGIILALVALAAASSHLASGRTCGFIAWRMFGMSAILLVLCFMFYGSWWFLM